MSNEIVKSANTAAMVFKVLSWVVLLVGAVATVAVLCWGFEVEEPWSWNGWWVAETWQSISFGVFGAVYIATYTAVVWATLQLFRSVALYVAGRSHNSAG